MIDVSLRRSPIGNKANQKATVMALGLRRIGQTVRHDDNPVIRGMVHSIRHLVTVCAVEDKDAGDA